MTVKDYILNQLRKGKEYFGVGKPGLGTFGQQVSRTYRPIVNELKQAPNSVRNNVFRPVVSSANNIKIKAQPTINYAKDVATGKRDILPNIGYRTEFKNAPVENTLRSLYGMGADTANFIAGGVIKPVNDIYSNVSRTVKGQDILPYNQLKSGASRIGYDIMGRGATNVQGVLKDAALAADPIINAWGVGKGANLAANSLSKVARGIYGPTAQKAALKIIAKEGAKVGAKIGAAYGAAQGLKENANKSLGRDLLNTGVSAVTSGLIGAGAGFATPYVGYGLREGTYQAANAAKTAGKWIDNSLGSLDLSNRKLKAFVQLPSGKSSSTSGNGKGAIDDGLDALSNEARKYKSAEEFTNSFDYHGANKRFDKFDSGKFGTGEGSTTYGKGVYLADKTNADHYARLADGETLTTRISPDAKLYDLNKEVNSLKTIPEAKKLLKSLGYTNEQLKFVDRFKETNPRSYFNSVHGTFIKETNGGETIANLLKSRGYDGVVYPQASSENGAFKVIYNPDKVQVMPKDFNPTDFYNQSLSTPKTTLESGNGMFRADITNPSTKTINLQINGKTMPVNAKTFEYDGVKLAIYNDKELGGSGRYILADPKTGAYIADGQSEAGAIGHAKLDDPAYWNKVKTYLSKNEVPVSPKTAEAGATLPKDAKKIQLVSKPEATEGIKVLESVPTKPVSEPMIKPKVQIQTPENKLPLKTVQEVSDKTASDVSLESIIQKSPTDVKSKVNIIDMFRTPDRVLNKIGLGEEAKTLRTQYEKYLKELPQEIDKIGQWAKQTTPEENTRIFKFLDGQKVDLTTKETKIANEVKDYLKQWADKLNLPQDKRITNYITHIFDKDLIKKEFPEELAKIIDEKVAGSVYDPFVLERLGKKGYIEDTWRALDAYVKRATRKANIDVALESIKSKAERLELSQFKYVKNYIDRINMRPTELDNMVDNFIKSSPVGYKLGQRPTANLTKNARQMVYRGTLGLNVGSTLKNLSQGANTYARLGERYTVKGYIDLFKNFRSNELKEVGVLADDLVQDRNLGVYKGFLEKADKALFYLFETAEKINRGAAYYGAKAKALNEGKSIEQAIEFAKKTVRDTQFTFGSIDTPPILQSDAAKTLLQFQSFNIKQGEFLGEMISKKDFAGLTRWIGASLAFVYGVGKMMGMKPSDIIPTLRVGGSPFFTTAKETYNAITNAPDEYGNKPENAKERFKPLLKSLVPLAPGGVQIKKSIEGLSATNKGYVETAKGLVRNPVAKTVENTVRGALFGQNNLPESQKYFQNKETPLGKKQSEIFKLIGNNKDYYNKVMSDREANKQDEKDKKALTTGNGKVQAQDLENGTYKLSSGKIYVPELDQEFATPQKAKIAIGEKVFEDSGKKSGVVDGIYYFQKDDGTTGHYTESEVNSKIRNQQMEKAKESNDYKSWLNLAQEKEKDLQKQWQEANGDQLAQLEIENELIDLYQNMAKYASYGGFKKRKKLKLAQISKPSKISTPKLSQPAQATPLKSQYATLSIRNGGSNVKFTSPQISGGKGRKSGVKITGRRVGGDWLRA